MENVDVYCFGHLLYEMAFGIPLFATNCDNIPNTCAPELRKFLYMCMYTCSSFFSLLLISLSVKLNFYSYPVIIHNFSTFGILELLLPESLFS